MTQCLRQDRALERQNRTVYLDYAHVYMRTPLYRFEGELEGSSGLIAAAYVRHVPEWRDLQKVKRHSPIPSPQLTRRKAGADIRASAKPVTKSPGGSSPRAARKHIVTEGWGDAAAHGKRPDERFLIPPHASKSSPRPNGQPESPTAGRHAARALPGMGSPAHGAGRGPSLRPGASDDELIKPKPIPMQPDRPDLARALSIRNQAAKVGSPTKSGPNELARHLQQLKAKQSFKGRMVDDPATTELKARLKAQNERLAAKVGVSCV